MADDKVTVSDAEIQKVEAQVKAAEQSERSAIEANIRKEIAAEQRMKDLEAQLAMQKAEAEKARAEAERVKAESEALLKKEVDARLAAQQAASHSKQPITTTNPFKGSETQKPAISRQDIPAIDAASYEAFKEKFRK